MHSDYWLNDNSSDFPIWKRWLQAISGHYSFHVCLGLIVCASFVPGVISLIMLWKTKAVVFYFLSVLLLALTGPIWAAIVHTAREELFGFPCYRFREYVRSIFMNFRKGYCLGLLFTFLSTVFLAPFMLSEYTQQQIPIVIISLLTLCLILLIVTATYSFYQIVRWELPIVAVLKNSFILLFSIGPGSFGVCSIWAIFWLCLFLFPNIVITLSLLFGLPVILCITEQAFFVFKLEKLMGNTPDSAN